MEFDLIGLDWMVLDCMVLDWMRRESERRLDRGEREGIISISAIDP